MLKNSSITLLVSGSIAAYKSAELIRELKKSDANVNVAMSKSACEFITPLTLQTLAGSKVYQDLFDLDSELEIGHISLADKANLILCAPATASILAKAAHGIADDLLTTVILAAKCPIVFIPAMNVNMWEAKVTRNNVAKLRELGHYVLDPDEGSLACGWTGAGRLPETSKIIEFVKTVLSPKPLKGVKVVITAGPTIEPVDPVRFLSNRSSGKMGFALAKTAKMLGADVTLISGPTSLPNPEGVKILNVETALEMEKTVFEEISRKENQKYSRQVVYMAAAVSDHRPKDIAKEKIKKDKNQAYEITFVPSPDILETIGKSRKQVESDSGVPLIIVGFALETCNTSKEILHLAREKLVRKNSDFIVGNLAHESFGGDDARVWIVSKNTSSEEVSRSSKEQVAEKIIIFTAGDPNE
jgi:phosphopantothenoylcysteine decarboxylase/phosphopantothenate--cysteine ligase